MPQTQLASNSDSTAGRKYLRPAYLIGGGLIALAIVAAVVLEQPGGRTSAGADPANSSVASFVTAPAGIGAAAASTTSTMDAAKPHFERSNEPAVEESVNTYGG